jgi:hypothetical protein
VSGTEFRYQPPTFRGHAVGCERCHGPGALHAEAPGAADATAPDLTIVNPVDLEPELRDSVCQQCHLLGTGRFLRAGRQPFEYRPGLPLRTFFAAFSAPRGDFRAVGHVEQTLESRCATASSPARRAMIHINSRLNPKKLPIIARVALSATPRAAAPRLPPTARRGATTARRATCRVSLSRTSCMPPRAITAFSGVRASR